MNTGEGLMVGNKSLFSSPPLSLDLVDRLNTQNYSKNAAHYLQNHSKNGYLRITKFFQKLWHDET